MSHRATHVRCRRCNGDQKMSPQGQGIQILPFLWGHIVWGSGFAWTTQTHTEFTEKNRRAKMRNACKPKVRMSWGIVNLIAAVCVFLFVVDAQRGTTKTDLCWILEPLHPEPIFPHIFSPHLRADPAVFKHGSLARGYYIGDCVATSPVSWFEVSLHKINANADHFRLYPTTLHQPKEQKLCTQSGSSKYGCSVTRRQAGLFM